MKMFLLILIFQGAALAYDGPMEAERQREHYEDQKEYFQDIAQSLIDRDPCHFTRLRDSDGPEFVNTSDHKRHAVYARVCPDDEASDNK